MKAAILILAILTIPTAALAQWQCPQQVAWEAAIGEIVGYEIYLDEEFVHTSRINRAEICIEDNETHSLKVVAIHTDGTTQTGINEGTVEELLIGEEPVPPIYGTARPDDATCGNFLKTGTVSFMDFGVFTQKLFGTCNNGIRQVSCEDQ